MLKFPTMLTKYGSYAELNWIWLFIMQHKTFIIWNVFKNVSIYHMFSKMLYTVQIEKINLRSEATWSGSPTWGFTNPSRDTSLLTLSCPFSFSKIVCVSLLLFLFIWFLQSLSSITTQILFSCTWFSISSLASFLVVCYEMLWSVLSWHSPAVKKAPSNHSPFILLTACERQESSRVWHSVGWNQGLGSTRKWFYSCFRFCKAIYCSVQFCNSWQVTINVWSHSVMIPRP